MPQPFVTVVIASRGNPMGLWMTINSAEQELKEAGIDFKFSIVTNGDGKLDVDTRQVLEMLKVKSDLLTYHRHHEEGLTPQNARQEAIDNSDSKYIVCLDNHVLLCPGFFKRFFHDAEHCDGDVVHSSTQYYINDLICYNYKLQLKRDFWGTSDAFAYDERKPFKVSAAGHGGVLFKRDSFKKYGGYYLSSGFVGYAGEELTVDLSTWMQGGTVWMSPLSVHKHWAATTRGYPRHYSVDFYKNLFSCAFILANETADDYVYDMASHFKACSKPFLKKSMFEILSEARERSKPYAAWLKERRQKTLEELLDWFLRNEVCFR